MAAVGSGGSSGGGSDGGGSGLSSGAIAGIVIGSVCGCCILLLIILLCFRLVAGDKSSPGNGDGTEQAAPKHAYTEQDAAQEVEMTEENTI